MAFVEFASLLKGFSNEAAIVRQERAKRESENFTRAQNLIQNILSDEAVPDETKAQARQAAMDMTMEHMGYKKAAKTPNPVRKLVEGLIGPPEQDYSAAMSRIGQPGVGSGNAKTQVGGLPPQDRLGGQIEPQAGPPRPPLSAVAEPPTPPTPLSRWQMTPEQLGERAGARKSAEMKATAATERQLKESERQAIVDSPMFKEIEATDPELATRLKAYLLGGVAGILPQGSTNLKSDRNRFMRIEDALKAYPEHVKELGEMQARGIPFVIPQEDPKTGKPKGFAPFTREDLTLSPADVTRQMAIGAYKETRGITGRDLTDTEARDAMAEWTAMNAPPSLVMTPDGRVSFAIRSDVTTPGAPTGGLTAGSTPTLYNMAGIPSTGGMQGVSRTPPPVLPSEAQGELAAYETGIAALKEIEPSLTETKYTLGPVYGNIALQSIRRAGGLGVDNENIRLTLLSKINEMTQAFGNGGKQLTGTEKEYFELYLVPQPTDTLKQALEKYDAAMWFFTTRRDIRIRMMPPRQREQLPPMTPTGPKIGDTKIFPNGNTGRWDGQGWELINRAQ